MTLRLFMFAPPGIMAAQVDQSSFTYPIAEVTMDNVSTNTDPGGDWQFVRPEMTVLFGSTAGADDLGRQRIRKLPTSDTLYFGRSSQGARDGEVNLADNAHIKVLLDFRAWTKIPFIDTSTDPATIYMDHEEAAGTNVSEPPPQSNTGVPAIGDVDPVTELLRVTIPHETNTSWAVATGATISTKTWELPDPAHYVSGGGGLYDTNKVDGDSITVDIPPGLHWYSQLVTDSNGKTHRKWLPLVARHPDGSTPGFIPNFEIVGGIEALRSGQRVSIRILTDIPKSSYPDGTLVMLYDGNMASPTDRSNLLFWGWHQSDPQRIVSERTGIVRDVVLDCVDIGGRLSILAGFPFSVGTDTNNWSDWGYMPGGEWRQFLTYHLKWFTNALDIADWLPSSQLNTYPFVERSSGAATIYEQVNEQALSVCPDFLFTVTRHGQMLVRVDPMLQLPANRTSTTQVTLTEANWREIQVTGTHWPNHNWLREKAIEAGTGPDFVVWKSIAPGFSPGQGRGEASPKEHLAQSQAQLNETTGQRYGRLNAPTGLYRIVLWSESDGGIEPAVGEWVKLTIPAAYAAQRGLSFTEARGMVHSMTKNYRYTRTGIVVENVIMWERETEGIPGATWTDPEPAE